MSPLLSRTLFFDYVMKSLELDPNEFDPGKTVWDLGIDSALIIELVLAIEDLGIDVPDDLPWERVTVDELYTIYALRAVPGSEIGISGQAFPMSAEHSPSFDG